MSTYRMENLMFLGNGCICLDRMTRKAVMPTVCWTMHVIPHQFLIWKTGNVKELFTGQSRIRIIRKNGNICMRRMWYGEMTDDIISITVWRAAKTLSVLPYVKLPQGNMSIMERLAIRMEVDSNVLYPVTPVW